jgi:hypothetical protein
MSDFDFIERLEADDLLRADMEFFVENLAQALRDKEAEIERLKAENEKLWAMVEHCAVVRLCTTCAEALNMYNLCRSTQGDR